MTLPSTMRAARLHGIRDLRIETIPVPEPASGDLLIQVEACGVCATDGRKYEIGVNDGHYPFNPGHEWLGRVAAIGSGVSGWSIGDRVYGDVYGGYADFCLIPAQAIPWSRGPLRLPEDLPAERAIFVEPLADCLHALHDQARVERGDRMVLIAAGVMGLKIVAEAARIGVETLVVEPLAERRDLALSFGAVQAIPPEGWEDAARAWAGDQGIAAVILSIGVADLVMPCARICKPGGRVVLFAGFGKQPKAEIDLNWLHYQEIALVGSEWIGTPPNQKRTRYDEALKLLVEGPVAWESLVTARCSFDDLEAALIRRQGYQGLKTMFLTPFGARP